MADSEQYPVICVCFLDFRKIMRWPDPRLPLFLKWRFCFWINLRKSHVLRTLLAIQPSDLTPKLSVLSRLSRCTSF
jgi:hypothetical protein